MGKYNATAKGKICRRFGINLFGNPKYDRLLAKRSNPPGQHGASAARKKTSEYGRQLGEKQKIKIMYGLREKQFRNTFKEALRLKGVTGENLMRLLECRLDNVVFRLGFAPTRIAARQLIVHGHIKLNGRRHNVPSHTCKVADEITVKDSACSKSLVQRGLDAFKGEAPAWMVREELKGRVERLPLREEMPHVADEQMVVELYSK